MVVKMGKATKPGYKLTDVGIIPEQWLPIRLQEVGEFSKGAGIRKDESDSGYLPCVRYGELYTCHNERIQKFHSFISEDVAKSSVRMRPGDVLFAGSGETKEEIGKCSAFVDSFEAYAGGDIVILSPKSADPVFLGYLLNSAPVSKQKASYAQGDAVVHIGTSSLKQIRIALPDLPEQSAIAQVLSDTDALIASLDALIEKKRAIKQGAMQELLTGKQRLSGFKDGWVQSTIGDMVDIRKGELITDSLRKDGSFPVIAGGKTPAYFHNAFNRQGKTITISGSGASAGYVGFYETPIFASDCSTIGESSKYSVEFVYFWLSLKQESIYYLQTGGAQPHIHPKDIGPMKIFYPPCVKEQSAIAQVLSDMDAEISALETKRDKYKAIKQGMMQELLTGNIRLVGAK